MGRRRVAMAVFPAIIPLLPHKAPTFRSCGVVDGSGKGMPIFPVIATRGECGERLGGPTRCDGTATELLSLAHANTRQVFLC